MRGRLTIPLTVCLCSTSAFAQSEAAGRTGGPDHDARRAQPEAELQAELAAEAEANSVEPVNEIRRSADEADLLYQYMAMIQNHVQRHWRLPVGLQPGLECSVNVVQLPTGDVVSFNITQCNGDDAARRSIELAVMDASPLPRPPSQAVFSRNLTLNFRPDE